MKIIDENESRRLSGPEMAFEQVREAFVAIAEGQAVVNPVVIGTGTKPGSIFSVKSGSIPMRGIAGVKIGSYWVGNEDQGLPRHSSTVFLIDPTNGRVGAAVEASGMNGWRTAAADAVAASVLARPESRVLSLVGAGHQAWFEAVSLARLFPLETILVASRTAAAASSLMTRLSHELGLDVRTATIDEACRAADILVTVTPSTEPLFDNGLLRPGTHIAAMGADQVGKRELPPGLLSRSRLFADLPEQSLVVGEFQHIAEEVRSGAVPLTAIGDVLRGALPGRQSPTDITIFDSSGTAIQDLVVARAVLTLHERESS